MEHDFIVGIDWSIASPAWTIMDTRKPENFTTFWFPKTKKQKAVENPHFKPLIYPEWETPQQRYALMADLWRGTIPSLQSCRYIVEGYSFAARGMVFNIAESTGMLKHQIYSITGEAIETYPVTSWKKNLGVGGNAKKKQVVDYFVDKTGINLYNVFNIDPDAKNLGVITDIADSWGIAQSVLNKESV